MTATQENREIEIITPLGKDVLLLQGFTVTEKLGRLFTLNAELLSVDDVVFEDILGQNVDIRVDLPEGKRVFNGYISSFSQDSHDGTYARYQATIHPWFWFLTRSSDCRIFQNKTVPEIIRKVCSDLGFTDISDKLSGEYRQWEYCVQYRETNFNFLSRLMEQEGIYYFFSHEQGKHTLNLCDCYSSHEVLSGNKEIPYNLEQGAIANKEESIHHWLVTKEIQAGMYALNEYDSTRPKMNEHVDSSIIQKHANADFELYDYPGEYVEPSDGRNYAQIRIEEQQAKYEMLQGQSNIRGLLLGGMFSLAGHPREDQNREYLLDSITQSIYTGDYTSHGSQGGSYSNSFTVIDSKRSFRPARVTPKPIVQGPQTAMVVGPSGEEIYPDKYGRVKVQFHWDRQGKTDENSSCWLRVSQPWAGKKWGGMFVPHVGHEVIVSFLEGDPDRPIVTGRVYNADNMPKEELSSEKTKSVWSDHGGNETVMEGKEGKQTIHTQQTCGNEFLMDGTSGGEKIELRDKYGNELVMDAVDGTIKIHSPTHESGIIIGKSDEFYSASDIRFYFDGNKKEDIKGVVDIKYGGDLNNLFLGAETKTTIGWKNRLIGGAKSESILGAETKTVRGLKKEVIKGTVFKKHVGMTYEKAENGGRFKTPNLIQMIKDSKEMKESERIKVDSDAVREIGNEYLIKAKKLTEKFTDKLEKGDNVILEASELVALMASSKLEMTANKWFATADEIKMKGDTKVKGKVSLG